MMSCCLDLSQCECHYKRSKSYNKSSRSSSQSKTTNQSKTTSQSKTTTPGPSKSWIEGFSRIARRKLIGCFYRDTFGGIVRARELYVVCGEQEKHREGEKEEGERRKRGREGWERRMRGGERERDGMVRPCSEMRGAKKEAHTLCEKMCVACITKRNAGGVFCAMMREIRNGEWKNITCETRGKNAGTIMLGCESECTCVHGSWIIIMRLTTRGFCVGVWWLCSCERKKGREAELEHSHICYPADTHEKERKEKKRKETAWQWTHSRMAHLSLQCAWFSQQAVSQTFLRNSWTVCRRRVYLRSSDNHLV